MVATLTSIQLRKYSTRKRTALLRRAKDLGMTPSAYVRHLIDKDLKLEHEARTKSLWELGAPLTKALQGLSENELDDLVDRARRTSRGARSR